MAREATGELRKNSAGEYSALVRTWTKRETFKLPTCTDEEQAKSRMNMLAVIAKRFRLAGVNQARGDEALRSLAVISPKFVRGAVAVCEELLGGAIPEIEAPKIATFSEVAKSWTSGELHRLYPDYVKAKDSFHDIKRLAVLEAVDVGGTTLGDLPIDRFTVEHAETAMRHLPERARRPATRRHYAGLMHRVLALAVYPLKHIAVNPLPKGFTPKAGKPPRYTYLYPDEEAALMACPADKVPLHIRLFYGFLCREGLRVSEAAGLSWRDIDLKRGTIKLDRNKTDDARAWVLGADVVRALEAWKRLSVPDGERSPIFAHQGVPVDPARCAEELREALAAAGVTRDEIFNSTELTGKLRAHDLRGTFTTLALATGKTETWVVDRTGWTSSAMIARYRRAARQAEELDLGWLRPLDQVIPELRIATALPLENAFGCRPKVGQGTLNP